MCDIVSCLEVLLLAIGVYAAAQYLYDNLRSVFQIFASLLFPTKVPFSKRYGPWAVVTGSSDGIGKEYAKNLAREGMNLMLISRTESKLVQLAEEIRSQYGVEVKWLAIDFSKGEAVYDRIEKELSQLEIGILVNNVGYAHPFPAPVEQIDPQQMNQTIFINMYPAARLVYMLLPELKARRRGMIVNVASGACFAPMPYMSLYAASKAFLMSYTLALQEELRNTGVECQLVAPFVVGTNMTDSWRKVSATRVFSVGVESYGRIATWLIGRTDFTTGHWYHALQAMVIVKLLPRRVISKILVFIFGYHVNTKQK